MFPCKLANHNYKRETRIKRKERETNRELTIWVELKMAGDVLGGFNPPNRTKFFNLLQLFGFLPLHCGYFILKPRKLNVQNLTKEIKLNTKKGWVELKLPLMSTHQQVHVVNTWQLILPERKMWDGELIRDYCGGLLGNFFIWIARPTPDQLQPDPLARPDLIRKVWVWLA